MSIWEQHHSHRLNLSHVVTTHSIISARLMLTFGQLLTPRERNGDGSGAILRAEHTIGPVDESAVARLQRRLGWLDSEAEAELQKQTGWTLLVRLLSDSLHPFSDPSIARSRGPLHHVSNLTITSPTSLRRTPARSTTKRP